MLCGLNSLSRFLWVISGSPH